VIRSASARQDPAVSHRCEAPLHGIDAAADRLGEPVRKGRRERAAVVDVGVVPSTLPMECPFALDELVTGHLRVAKLVARLDDGS
jgi:hypothetical protein